MRYHRLTISISTSQMVFIKALADMEGNDTTVGDILEGFIEEKHDAHNEKVFKEHRELIESIARGDLEKSYDPELDSLHAYLDDERMVIA